MFLHFAQTQVICSRTGPQSATRMLIAVVISFLCIHALNVVTTIMELTMRDHLTMMYNGYFYPIMTDVISLMAVCLHRILQIDYGPYRLSVALFAR